MVQYYTVFNHSIHTVFYNMSVICLKYYVWSSKSNLNYGNIFYPTNMISKYLLNNIIFKMTEI